MATTTHQHVQSGSSADAGLYGGATEWSTMVVGRCNGTNLHRYEPEQLARWANYGQAGPIVCTECGIACLCYSTFVDGTTSVMCPTHGNFNPMSMAPELKRFMGMLPGYMGNSPAQGQATAQHTSAPIRPGYQSMFPSGNDARNVASWAPRLAFNRPAESAADPRPTVSSRSDVVMGENVERRAGELPIPTIPSSSLMDVSSPGGSHAAGSRQSPNDGNVPSSRSSNHDDNSCPFLHGWQRHNRLVQVSSPLVQEMSPGTREYLRKNATTIFLHWMRDANFLDDLLDSSARTSSPSSSSPLSS